MSPSRGSGSWNSEYAPADWQPGYGQVPNSMHSDYPLSLREYQSHPSHSSPHGRTSDGFHTDDYNPRFSRYDYPDSYTDSSRIPERRSPDYTEYHSADSHSSHGPYEGGSFMDRWVESERDFRPSSRPFDYSTPHSSRSYDSPPPGSRRYHSSARDYDGYARPRDASRERDTRRGGYENSRQQWPGPENDRGRENHRGDAFDEKDSRNSGYSNYRRPPPREDNTDRHNRTSFRSRSPTDRNSPTQEERQFAPRLHSLPRRPSPGPPLTRRTNPTKEYIEISHQPPSHLLDPATSRKLIVLDLNGSLVLRGAHTGRAPGRAFDNPTQPRLRPVHPRPYLKTFTTYLLHDQTKKWLDTMVWSSAQPHSVHDMVGKAFLQRKDELTAVWARDTLGLTTEEYCKTSPSHSSTISGLTLLSSACRFQIPDDERFSKAMG